MVSVGRIIAIVSPESAPIKRIISDAREKNQLIDATFGRRTRAVIIADNSSLILSAIQPETIAARLQSVAEHTQSGGERNEESEKDTESGGNE